MTERSFFVDVFARGVHRPAAEPSLFDRARQAASSSVLTEGPRASVQGGGPRTYHAIVADRTLAYDELVLELIERRDELAAREDRTPSVAAELLLIDDAILPMLSREWTLRHRRRAERAGL
ncbi:MAG TPA: hypothetical protein VFU97_24615 [Xanthobacteraceae bacterium]|nr:hypothetical protein [Xanthobacteraceae bacterium]